MVQNRETSGSTPASDQVNIYTAVAGGDEGFVVGYASNPLNIDDSFRVGRARGYCNDYEDEDE